MEIYSTDEQNKIFCKSIDVNRYMKLSEYSQVSKYSAVFYVIELPDDSLYYYVNKLL